jgi:alpha-amylase
MAADASAGSTSGTATQADATSTSDSSDGVDGTDGNEATDGLDAADGLDTADGLDASDLGDTDIAWPGWDNATVYFVIIDRFHDGDPSNNTSYGRELDGEDNVGTFHGGDLAGLTAKLNEGFFSSLGVSAIWITAPYEQIHGWVVGGGGGFKHYAYHGYYPLDWTRLDANFGTEDELGTFVDTAHSMGIRVILDVVMNHAGYATAQDLTELNVDVVADGWQSATVDEYYDYIDFESESFKDWWGPQWVRADLGGNYSSPGTDLLTQSVSFLPDFKTESPVTNVKIPPFFANKADTGVVQYEDYRVRDYLISWLVRWVEEYGIDGFRCDTAKHVDLDAWGELSEAANAALRNWRLNNPDKAFPDSEYPDPQQPFWMTGEVFPHGVKKDDYYTVGGFDSLINFQFQKDVDDVLEDIPAIDSLYAEYAEAINSDPDFNVLTYISSHDTSLFFDREAKGDLEIQKLGGSLLLLCPGAVQIFYGDENAREKGPGAGDATQGLRSDYEFGANSGVFVHWQRLGLFRKRHPAIGGGSHKKLSDTPYTFRRALESDVVYAAIGASGEVTFDVSEDWQDGALVRDSYGGATATVDGGKVTFTATSNGVLLLEPVLD